MNDEPPVPATAAHAARAPAWLGRAFGWLDLLLVGPGGLLRRRTARTLLGLGMYLVGVVAELAGGAIGLVPASELRWPLLVYMSAVPSVFYLLVRSGWSLRWRDPGLSVAQYLCAVSALVLSYPGNGAMRGLNLLFAALVPLFSFLFMAPRTLRTLALVTLAAFGAMMAFLALSDPARFDPRIEVMHFVILAICLPAMAIVLGRASSMRARVRAQRTELQAALERIEAINLRDELTGLLNRRRMAELLDEEARRDARQPHSICLALIDIDHFKRINDSLGHSGGDEVLRLFAHLAAASMPAGCELARWGGEEFLLLVPGAGSLAVAQAIVERVRERLLQADVRDGEAAPVTFSAGIAEGAAADTEAVLEYADSALYRAKADGRNRTVLFTPGGVEKADSDTTALAPPAPPPALQAV